MTASATGRIQPPAQEFLPTRNFPLNVLLGGGLPLGLVHEVSGSPGLGKTSFCLETAGDALKAKYQVLLMDREGTMSADRMRHHGIDPSSPRLWYYSNQPAVLTIEQVFRYTAAAVFEIRTADCQKVVEKLGDSPSATLLKRYQEVFRDPSLDAKGIVKKLTGTYKKEKVWYYQYLHQKDRTPILWIVDSITSMPGQSELVAKMDSSVESNQQLQIMAGGSGSNAQALAARAWSSELRNQPFIDSRFVGVWTAQMRMSQYNNNWFEDEAEPNATKFYGRCRLRLTPMGGKESFLHLDPKGDGLLYSVGNLAYDETHAPVGRRLWVNAKKVAGLARFRVPWVWAYGQTDAINTVWEFFVDRGVLTTTRAPNYYVAANFLRVEGADADLDGVAITRDSFMAQDYADYIDTWRAIAKSLRPAITLL